MLRLIEDSIGRTPDRAAFGVADGSMRLSYRQTGKVVRTLADQLAGTGITSNDRIALYCDNRPEFVLALLAAWTIGAAVVPLNPRLTGTEVRSRLDVAGAGAVLLPPALTASYPGDAAPAWVIDIAAGGTGVTLRSLRQGSGAGPAGPPAPDQDRGGAHDRGLALLMFTTGSTGRPKVVPLTHVNLAASVAGIVSGYHLGPDDATLLAMPMFHGHGLVAGLLATLASGGAAHLPATGRFSAHLFWQEIVGTKSTWYTAVPAVHQILLARAAAEYPAATPVPLRFIRSCSAPLAPAVSRRLRQQFGAPVICAYGMTETAHQATSNPLPRDGAGKEASVGLPTGLDIRIVTAGGGPAAAAQTGEVWVRGPALTSGYLDDPQATADSFVEGWFRTGDLGYQDSDGYLFLSGRIKDMINRGGEKIAPQSVEAVLLADPAVLDALAFPVPDATYGEEINAAVILRPGHHATQAELQRHCRTELSAFEIPKKIYFLDRFPRTGKGDGDRRALAAMLTARGSSTRPA